MRVCGFSEEEALQIEKNYHDLYQVSDKWVQDQLDQASKDGYVTCAFGLRVRTPRLKQVIRGNSKTPKEAEAEARTAGNALGQSYGLLNSRAGSEFLSLVRKSKYAELIRPCAQIHDAQYYLVKDDIDVIKFVNDNLVKAIQWQDDPAIYHDQVGLEGNVSIFWPTWQNADEIELPNSITATEIEKVVKEALDGRKE